MTVFEQQPWCDVLFLEPLR